VIEDRSIREAAEHLLTDQLFGVLSTYGRDGPHSVIVSFAVSDHFRELIIVTPRSTRKFANILKEDSVSFFLDNRSNRITDLQRLTALEARGRAVEIPQEDICSYRDIYSAKYPELKEFAESPSNVLVKIKVKSYEVIHHFQNVTILDVT